MNLDIYISGNLLKQTYIDVNVDA